MRATASPPLVSPPAKNGDSPPAPLPGRNVPSARRPTKATILVAERPFWTHLPGRIPAMLTAVRTAMAAAPTTTGARAPDHPVIPQTVAPRPAASAAIDPGKPIQKLVQPLRKPTAGPYASRR